jgi:DNA polymerase elongation subunit (family B)
MEDMKDLTDKQLLEMHRKYSDLADREYYQLGLDYNLYDTRLVEMFEEQVALLALSFTVAYKSGVNFNEAFGTVGLWDTTIFRALMDQGRVPFIKSASEESARGIVGGYVKDPQKGMKDWVVSFDLNSLYPHLMMQYNMSPETYQHNVKEDVSQQIVLDGNYKNTTKYAVAANGACFSKEREGIIPQIIQGYYDERAEIKVKMLMAESELEIATTKDEIVRLKKLITQLHNSQMSIKILMNGLYGSTANAFFIYYISDMAEGITTSGQLSTKWAAQAINMYVNKVLKTTDVDYCVYCDTDSVYVNLGPLVEKVFGTVNVTREQGESFIDKVCKEKIEPLLDDAYDDLAERMGAYRNAMKMKREKIADKAIFVAKKRYILNVLNSEGVHYDEPKVSVTGIDAARSSTPEICRKKFFEAFKIIVTQGESETQEFIRDFKEEFFGLSVQHIAKVSGTNDVDGYADPRTIYKKACPIHIRGCLLSNKWTVDNDLVNRYPLIQSGDKIKFVYLKLPNPLRENIISFIESPPAEMEIDNYVDREKQFSKVFLDPIQNILDSLGWSATKVDTLEDFFA